MAAIAAKCHHSVSEIPRGDHVTVDVDRDRANTYFCHSLWEIGTGIEDRFVGEDVDEARLS